MSYDDYDDVAVLDIGSLYTRIGPAGSETVDSVMFTSIDNDNNQRGVATAPSGVRWPVVKSRVADWEAMESLIEMIFDDCARTQTYYKAVCLLEPFGLERSSKERMIQILFEQEEVMNMGLAQEVVMPLYANGRTTGLSVVMGHGSC